MFKKTLKHICIVLLLVAAVFLIRSINGQHKDVIKYTKETEAFIDNKELKQLTGSGYQTFSENQYLSVQLNFDDGNVLITNKENGYVWRSCPTDEEINKDNSNDMWKNNLRSPVVYNYVNDVAQSDANYGNVYSNKNKISVYQLENGVRVYFEFLDTNITLAYDLRLVDDYLEVSIPSNLISDTGIVYMKTEAGNTMIDKTKTFLLTDFMIFPYLGAVFGESDTSGYLFVPDGVGGIMDFSVDGNATSQYVGHVYGSDLALLNNYDKTIFSEMNRTYVHFPVYGLVRDKNSFFAIIDEGETQADIIASKKGVQTGFHTIASKFKYRLKYKLVTNTATGDGYFSYSEFNVKDTRKLLLHFDSGNNADYVHMAKLYRNYLIDKNDIHVEKSQNADTPLQLYIIGGDVKKNMIWDSFLTATTFEQAKEIVQYLKDQGVKNVDVIYKGWAKDGNSVDYPDRFPVPSDLGGESDLISLSSFVHELGYKFYLEDDYIQLYTSKGISIRKNTVYNIQDNSILKGSYANTAYSLKQMEDCYTKYKKYAIDGIEENSLGWYLYSDFNKNNVMNRADSKQAQINLVNKMAEKYGKVCLARASAYLVRDNVHFTYFTGSNYYNIIDETVPFYSIALHGLVTYDTGSYNNDFYEPEQQFLKAIEYGANVSFDVTAQPTSALMFGSSSYYYSTEFDLWKEKIVSLYKRYQQYSEATAGRFMDDYEMLSKDIIKVTYDGNISVVINYTNSIYQYNGITIPANDFVIVE